MRNATQPHIDRSILVFAIWASLGFLGLGLFLEGMARDLWGLAAAGVGVILAAFVAHIIVNTIFDTGFSRGEAALGIGVYGILAGVFIIAALSGGMTRADYYAGLTLLGALALGFPIYLVTRHGLRGAFSHFHARPRERDGSAPR